MFFEFCSCLRRGSSPSYRSDDAFDRDIVGIAKSPVKLAAIQDQQMVQLVRVDIEHELVRGLGSLRGGAGIYILFVLGGGSEGEGVCSSR